VGKIRLNSKKFTIYINGKSYEISIGEITSSPISVFVDGKEYMVELKKDSIEKTPSGISNTSDLSEVKINDKNDSFIDTNQIKDGTVRSPMPGVIIEIKVSKGDDVKKGDILMILESMKMENSIKTSIDGIVSSIYISQGDSVQFGQSLMEIE